MPLSVRSMVLRSVALRANVAAILSGVSCLPMGLGSGLLMKHCRGESIRRSNSLVLAKVFRIPLVRYQSMATDG